MIAVTAATGALGRLVIGRLLSHVPAEQVIAVVRAPERAADLAARGIEVRRGDYDDQGTLRTAFEGVHRLLLISSPELDTARRTAQHLAAVEAARACGTGAVVYTSFLGADTRADGITAAHHATERALLASGLPHTLLRHPFYGEAWLNPGLPAAVAGGELVDGTGGRGINSAVRADLAEAAVRVLTEDHHLGHAYDLTGDLWTYPQLADVLTRVSGTPVSLRERSESESLPGAQGWLEGQIRSGALERQTGDLRQLLGRPPTTLEQTVTALLSRPA